MVAKARLVTKIDADNSGFKRGVRDARHETKGFAAQLSSMKGMIAGAFSVGVVVAFGRKMLKMADDINTLAQTFDTSISSIVEMKMAMAASGIETDRFMRILGTLRQRQGEVARGTKTYTDAVAALNISEQEFIGMSVQQVLETVAQKYHEAGRTAQAFNAVTQLFGQRIGPEMIEVFDRIRTEGFDRYSQAAQGATEGIRVLANASDALETTWSKIEVGAAKSYSGLMSLAEGFHLAAMEAMQGRNPVEAFFEGLGGAGRRNVAAEMEEAAREAEAYIKRIQDMIDKASDTTPEVSDWEYNKKAMDEYYQAQEDALKKLQEQNDALEKQNGLYDDLAAKRSDLEKEAKAVREEYTERMAEAPERVAGAERARVDTLQQIGGIVGGAAGGDMSGRILEKQLRVQELQKEIAQEMADRLEEIHREDAATRAAIEQLNEGVY